MQPMKETFRWYGPGDPVPLAHSRQAGATGILTALHAVYDGSPWPVQDLAELKAVIEGGGLEWSVVESIPVHSAIKTGGPERDRYIGYYEPYATSHEALDKDVAVQEETRNVARAVAKAVVELRAGRLQAVQPVLSRPRPK